MTHSFFHKACAVVPIALVLMTSAASAHATLANKTGVIGKTERITLKVPHGCGDEATHTVRIMIPEGFHSVKPMPHAGWALETVRGDYAHTYLNHGHEIVEGVQEIIWSGGNLPNEWYDEFVFRGTFGTELVADSKFYFPAIQVCENGTEEWTNTTADKDAGKPAPKLTLVANSSHDHHAGHGATTDKKEMAHGASHDGVVKAGDLQLSGAFTRAMAPNAGSGGGFVTITNHGHDDDRLVGVKSDAANRVEIHEMKMEGDVMKMGQLHDGIAILAGETVTLEPGGLHIMFMQVEDRFVEGEMVPVTLVFEKAGDVDVMLQVGGAAAKSAHAHH